jgi:hypothetical protein
MILTFANEYGNVPQITTNQCKEKFKLSKKQLGYTKKIPTFTSKILVLQIIPKFFKP